MVGNIQNPDYETVTARCEHCGSLCVFHRLDDLEEPGPYSGRYVTCHECKQKFWIWGDIINPTYELMIHAAYDHFGTKHYRQCVDTLTQAWEVFYSLFADSNYLYRPYFTRQECVHVDEHYDSLTHLKSQLSDVTKKATFYPLRNILLNTILKRVHPETLQESEVAISRIKKENFGQDPGEAAVEKFSDGEIRELLRQLLQLTVANLRNEAVHHRAYRPQRAEVEKCLEEIGLLYRLKHTLPVYTFDYWRFKTRQQQR